MTGKALAILIVGTTASFLILLLVMNAMVGLDPKQHPKRLSSRARIEDASKTDTVPHRSVKSETTTTISSIPAPVEKPASLHSAVEKQPVEGDGLKMAEQKVRQATQAAYEFKIVRNELQQQIASLKQERRLMLVELSNTMANMSAAEAANQIEALDDKAAVEVLRQTSAEQRAKILEQFSSKRAARLRRKI